MGLENYFNKDQEIISLEKEGFEELSIVIDNVFLEKIDQEGIDELKEISKKIKDYHLFIEEIGEEKYNEKIKQNLGVLKNWVRKKIHEASSYSNKKDEIDSYLNELIGYVKLTDDILKSDYENINEGDYAHDLSILGKIKERSIAIKKKQSSFPDNYQNANLCLNKSDEFIKYLDRRLMTEIEKINKVEKKIKKMYKKSEITEDLLFCEEQLIEYKSIKANIHNIITMS